MPGKTSPAFALFGAIPLHPAQKRALLAIITMIEQGFQQLKGLILTPEATTIHPTASSPRAQRDEEEGYLGEDEELKLHELMEKDRARLVAEMLQGRDD